MNQQEFIDSIKLVVIDNSIEAVTSLLESPPGRAPEKTVVKLSNWFNNLSDEDKAMITDIIRQSVEISVFGFLCVLDGVRAIEDIGEKGELVLSYKKNGTSIWLNNPNEDYLHDLL